MKKTRSKKTSDAFDSEDNLYAEHIPGDNDNVDFDEDNNDAEQADNIDLLNSDVKPKKWFGILLYVDGISCPGINEHREQSPLRYWSLDKLQKRESMEIKQGGFGLGVILEHFVGDGVNETDGEVEAENYDNSTKKVKFKKISVLFGQLSMLTSVYNRIKHDKVVFEKTIRDSLIRFPNTTDVSGFVDKYEELFRDRSIFGDLLNGEVTGKKDFNCGNPSCEEEANQAGVTQFNKNSLEPEVAGVWTQEVIDIANILEKSSRLGKNDLESLSKNDIPSFSLGLTQESPVSHKVGVNKTDHAKDVLKTPGSDEAVDIAGDWTQEMLDAAYEIEKLSESKKGVNNDEDVYESLKRVKSIAKKNVGRSKQNALAKCSPYIDRAVNINKCLTKDEKKIWNYLMTGAVDHVLDIFATHHGTVIRHFHMISLSPGQEVFNEVIDCWAAVLNFEEKKRSPSSLRRLFCGTYPFYGWVITGLKESDEERIAFFENHLHHVLENKDDLYNLRPFDVNPSIRVIDNMHEKQSFVGLHDDSDYFKKDIPYKVKYIFLMYLHLMGHPKATEIESCQIEKLRISWATTNNFVDCGVFVVRHMEMYMGNHTWAWDCGFPKDERVKKKKVEFVKEKVCI
ncbi:hypothetical protein R6Q59_030290 [Mikania micrantha]